jgi:hypothetical protein
VLGGIDDCAKVEIRAALGALNRQVKPGVKELLIE